MEEFDAQDIKAYDVTSNIENYFGSYVIAWTLNDKLLISIQDTEQNQIVLLRIEEPAHQLLFSTDGRYLVCNTYKHTIVYSTQNWQVLHKDINSNKMRSFFSKDNKMLLSYVLPINQIFYFKVRDLDRRRIIAKVKVDSKLTMSISDIAISPNNKEISIYVNYQEEFDDEIWFFSLEKWIRKDRNVWSDVHKVGLGSKVEYELGSCYYKDDNTLMIALSYGKYQQSIIIQTLNRITNEVNRNYDYSDNIIIDRPKFSYDGKYLYYLYNKDSYTIVIFNTSNWSIIEDAKINTSNGVSATSNIIVDYNITSNNKYLLLYYQNRMEQVELTL